MTTDDSSRSTAEATKETYLWQAKLAQEANRFEDMATYMRQVVQTGIPMSKDEDNMLAVAYKRVLDAKRSARWALASVEQKDGMSDREKDAAREYRARVDAELRAVCADVLAVVGDWLSSARAAEAPPATSVFYWKLRGDYNRYAAEAADDDSNARDAAVAESRAAYEEADRLGRQALPPVDPIRLGLMLNYSVFLYQVCRQRRQGHDLAKRAFDDAVAEIDAINEQTYDDSTLILRLIRDNLSIWIQENGGASFDDAQTVVSEASSSAVAPPPQAIAVDVITVAANDDTIGP